MLIPINETILFSLFSKNANSDKRTVKAENTNGFCSTIFIALQGNCFIISINRRKGLHNSIKRGHSGA